MIVATPDDLDALAAVHAEAFERPWSATDLQVLTAAEGAVALADEHRLGFILIRVVADEAEILTLAVSAKARRQGLGRRLVMAGAQAAAARGARALFLEVAADNAAAIALYRTSGFVETGRRKGYYPRHGAPAADALVFSLSLAAPA
jgi:ribosomal-protein-alanine N-acetyltransferase